MNIEIKIDQITLDTIVGEVVTYDDEGDIEVRGHATVADKVAAIVAKEAMKSPYWASLTERVTNIRNEMIREAVKPLIREALERPIRRTNSYGERVGAETTLSEIIMDEAKKIFTEVKDSYTSRRPFIAEVVSAEVKKAFQADIQEQVKKARQAVTQELGATLSEAVIKAALEGLKAR
jgi:hypothetical protein